MNKHLISLLGIWAIGHSLLLHAAEDTPLRRQELNHAIQLQALTLNVNQVEKFIIDFHFSTYHGMYAYRQLTQWALAAPPAQRADLLALVRGGMEAVVAHSGMGLPVAGVEAAGLLFNQGLPRYTVMPDFSRPATLKWDPASFDRQVTPDAVGQSLAAKALFIQSDTSAEGKKLREILLPSALQEFLSLTSMFELGGEKGGSHMPALLKMQDGKWQVANGISLLHGQMSLIQGLSRLHTMLSAPSLENDSIQGKRLTEWRKEVRRVLESVVHTTIKLHFDQKSGSFNSVHDRGSDSGKRLETEDAGYALEVLAELSASLPKNDPLRELALKQLSAQAAYLNARLEGKNVAPKAFLLGNDRTASGLLLRLEDQLALVNGLLAAEQVTGEERYAKAALAIFTNTRTALWSEPAGIFRSAAGQTVSAYDGRMFGLSLDAWRRLQKWLPAGEAEKQGERLIEAVLKRGGLQQSDGPATGEPRQPEDFIRDDLPQLIDSVVTLEKEEQSKKITAAIQTLSDQDKDGVPGFRFAGGRFGAAPVIIMQTGIKTPYDTPTAPATPARSAP